MNRFALLFMLGATGGCHLSTSCDDVDCVFADTVKLHVIDAATGQPAPLPPGWLPTVFSVNNANLGTTCAEAADGGACDVWGFMLYGPQTIHITFPGYAAADVTTNVSDASSGCCPSTENPQELTVRLQPTR